MADSAAKDPVVAGFDSLHEQEASSPSKPSKPAKAGTSRSSGTSKAAKAPASKASSKKATSARSKQAGSRTATGKGAGMANMDREELKELFEDVLDDRLETVENRLGRVEKKVSKSAKRAKRTGDLASEEEREARLVEERAGKGFRKERKRKRKEKDEALGNAAETGGITAAGGAAATGSDDKGDDKTSEVDAKSADEIVQYFRENKKLPEGLAMSEKVAREVMPQVAELERKQEKIRFRFPLGRG